MRNPLHVSEILESIILMADDEEYQAISDQEEVLSRQQRDIVDDEDWDRLRRVQEEREVLMVKMEDLIAQKNKRMGL